MLIVIINSFVLFWVYVVYFWERWYKEYLLDGKPELVEYDGDVPIHDFAVVLNGDSMIPLFDDRQIIFVKKTT
jgi:hypothetical protein